MSRTTGGFTRAVAGVQGLTMPEERSREGGSWIGS